MGRIAAACKERGVWPFTHFNRIHVAPPINSDDDDVRRAIAALDEALEIADEYCTGG
jgi:taurine--2-oxoglutarate transaminase